MEPTTLDHLWTAERNRDLARALLSPAHAGLRPDPWGWVAVIAFYAAVHCVNAYLWEAHRVAPANHADRRTRIHRDPAIRGCRESYRRLQALGYQARYIPAFALAEQDARDLLDVDFRRVEAVVMRALRQPIPTW